MENNNDMPETELGKRVENSEKAREYREFVKLKSKIASGEAGVTDRDRVKSVELAKRLSIVPAQ